MTPTRSPAYHSWRERSSVRPSPPKLEWRRMGPGHPTRFRQQRRGGWRTRPWPFISRAEPIIPFGGPVAEETFGMANDEEPVEKALGALPSVAVTSEDSVNSNLATLMVDSGASGDYFDDAIIRDLKHRLQAATKSSFGSISWWCPELGATCFR